MIHPTNLLRTDSNGNSFAAPMGNYLNELDCGVVAIPWVAKRLNLEKFATLRYFVAVLSLIGFIHGVVISYFRGTSQLWSVHYGYSKYTVGWIIYGNEIFAGIFALCVAYWGNRIHRATWMGALTIFLSISCITLAIPEIYNPFTAVEINSAITGPLLCNNNSTVNSTIGNLIKELDEVTLTIFIIFQVILALAQISFIAHGVTYIDDHISPKHSPAYIGIVIAASEIGKQIGIYFSWTPYILRMDRIFLSPVWIGIMVAAFAIGTVMALYPKTLPNILMMKSVHSLISLAAGLQPTLDDDVVDGIISGIHQYYCITGFCILGFFETLWRLLKNKILMINTFSFVLIQSAMINFRLLEKYFNQSKYHVSIEKDSSGYSDPELIQFTTNMLAQPLFAISIVTAGMIVSKMTPKAKYLISWNIVAFLLIALIFASSVFWKCTRGIQNEHEHAITIPFCSSRCACTLGEPFQPVCVDGHTYFSPCLAGCKSFTSATKVYQNCSCGTTVTEGSCDEERCRIPLAVGQANAILSNGLLATTVVSNIVISMRSVSDKDKAPAIGLGMTFLQIVPYIPVRLIYLSIADVFCEIKSEQGCQYFSELFPIFLSITTIVMMVSAAVVSMILLFFLNDLPLYIARRYASSADLDDHGIRLSERNPSNENNNPYKTNGVGSTNDPAVNEESPFIRQFYRRVGHRPSYQSKINEERVQAVVEDVATAPQDVVTAPPTRSSSRKSNKGNTKTSVKSTDVSLTESLEALANELGDNDSDTDFNMSLQDPAEGISVKKNLSEYLETQPEPEKKLDIANNKSEGSETVTTYTPSTHVDANPDIEETNF